jgi:Ni/Co efflux regulator RcnB
MKRIVTSILLFTLAAAPLAASAGQPSKPTEKPATSSQHEGHAKAKAKASKKTSSRSKDKAVSKSKSQAQPNSQLSRDKNLH